MKKIILFDSYARSDFSMDSDLDLFIIKGSEEPSRMMRRKIDALLRGRQVKDFGKSMLINKTI